MLQTSPAWLHLPQPCGPVQRGSPTSAVFTTDTVKLTCYQSITEPVLTKPLQSQVSFSKVQSLSALYFTVSSTQDCPLANIFEWRDE